MSVSLPLKDKTSIWFSSLFLWHVFAKQTSYGCSERNYWPQRVVQNVLSGILGNRYAIVLVSQIGREADVLMTDHQVTNTSSNLSSALFLKLYKARLQFNQACYLDFDTQWQILCNKPVAAACSSMNVKTHMTLSLVCSQ